MIFLPLIYLTTARNTTTNFEYSKGDQRKSQGNCSWIRYVFASCWNKKKKFPVEEKNQTKRALIYMSLEVDKKGQGTGLNWVRNGQN